MTVERASVLVVDDSVSKRYVLGSWLRRAGYEVFEASSGEEALREVRDHVPDLVVLDVHLPDLSGIEVCRRIKRDRESAGVPVLHVSAIAVDAGDRSIGLDEGADAYLVDPIEPREFLSTVGALLRQSRRYAEEHRIALTLQRSLLPATLPDLAGLRVAARYHASAAQAEVGGDFFDAFDTPDGEAFVVIGDVQGHSLGAAIIMAELRYALRAYAFDGHRPAAVLDRLNRLMLLSHPEATATVCILTFPPDRSRVTIVNAGHLPPLLIGPDRLSYWEAGAGVLLGVDAGAQIADTMPLPAGSRLLLFTDGLVERRSEPIEVSLATLASSVAAAHGLGGGTGPRRARRSITDVADGLLAAADGAADDVALVLVEAIGPD
ncbi:MULTISPECIES: PP2C family protein-serine/threonine phosphatase [Frankia]|uniref:Regulatory protein n=1 Tax=Frankia alni (strain DSM 45986 / CECT 9034 / ACN14a) TaxID=326424 RepID=Q0RR80_FRAAA|nr:MULTISPECIES: fused response regulator/phosphatase [Frankia]CAJ59941.1 Putative regulatory protein [Frankia alni ACN14a]